MGGSESRHSDTFRPEIGGSSRSNGSDERNEEEKKGLSTTAACVVGAIGTGLLAWGAYRGATSSSESEGKVGYDQHQEGQALPDGTWREHTDFVTTAKAHGGYNPDLRYRCVFEGLNVASSTLKILSYNVWSDELEVAQRMKAIGELIEMHSPDIICFQEVTPAIYNIFQDSEWWKDYRCSIPDEKADKRKIFCMQLSKVYLNSSFKRKPLGNGKELCVTKIMVCDSIPLEVATSHLKSTDLAEPEKADMCSSERKAQANKALDILKDSPNAVFGGDMNWKKVDGKFPLLDGWVDAWVELKPGENGHTYDTKSNPMLLTNRGLNTRLDRFVCHLNDFELLDIEMVGTDAIPDLSYCKDNWGKKKFHVELPVLPSDHYGLLLTIRKK